MSIRVQCGGCGTVMTVRDDYAGSTRRCPKCKGEFHVPTLEEARAVEAAQAARGKSLASELGDDFDPVAFLTGEASGAKAKGSAGKTSAAAPPPAAGFDPMDVLAGGAKPAPAARSPAKSAGSAASPAAPPGKEPPPASKASDFDPMAVLGDAPAKPAPPKASPPPSPPAAAVSPPPPAAAPAAPEKPQPRRPSWAKAAPEPEKNDWDAPATPPVPEPPPPPAAPEKPQPRRPSWAKAAPEPEKNDWDDPAAAPAAAPNSAGPPETPQPRRPSWAKPLPEEKGAPKDAAIAADASPAAKAAAEAMAASVTSVSGENPALQEAAPKRPWIDPPAIAAWFRRRTPLFIRTAVASALLFGAAWLIVKPRSVDWKVIGKNDRLSPVPVTGRLTVDGKPVPNARIMFHPRGPAYYRSSEGRTDGDGNFELQFCEGHPGAPPGNYRVQLQLINKDGSDGGIKADELLREQAFVVPQGGGAVDVTLSTKAPK